MMNWETNWETDEVIEWLNSDEGIYTEVDNLLRSATNPAECLRLWVENGNAPQGLYQSFNSPPKSLFNAVDWDLIVDYWLDDR